MESYKDIYKKWLNSSLLSNDEKNELISIKNNDKEIEDRFIQDLAFGTAGLRGVMEVGTNRMNRFIVRKASQGFANYLNKIFKNPTVAIAYDSRNNSTNFAKEAAATLAENNVKVFIYKELMPTPALSFAVRYFHASAGIVITASHNPKQYNGYKVYGSDGCQCTSESANAILNEITLLDVFNDVKIGDFDKHVNNGNIKFIECDCFNAYIESTKKQSIYNENKVLKLVYTPLYGAGYKCVSKILEIDGFKNVINVDEQCVPNGNFPTCPYPNPEMPDALKLGIDKLLKENADVLVATDPDSDRLGVVVNNNGKPVILTGNEVGLILFDSCYHARKANGSLTDRPILVKTIVSTDMANVMANDLNVTVKEVLTGFKYIGEQILFLEKENRQSDYILGFEESCGYLSNTDVRDKDAVNAVLLLAEAANHYKLEGRTLIDRLNELYKKYGDFKTKTLTFEFPGVEGMSTIQKVMNSFRKEDISSVISDIDHIGDYELGIIKFTDHEEPTNLPKSNVVKFFLNQHETITVRPSGTEPKLKVYLFCNGLDSLNNKTKIINDFIDKIK